jgi:hypothetical protein
MRLFMFPVIAAGLLVAGTSDEPSEVQMRAAFESALAHQVEGVLDFVDETQGREAVETVKSKKSDRYEILMFHKQGCAPPDGRSLSYLCSFSVDIDLATGIVRETLSGQFRRGDHGGLTYTASL